MDHPNPALVCRVLASVRVDVGLCVCKAETGLKFRFLFESPSHPQVADMVTRLSTGDWFTAKVSACGLFTAAYKHIEEHDQRTLLRAQVCRTGDMAQPGLPTGGPELFFQTRGWPLCPTHGANGAHFFEFEAPKIYHVESCLKD